LATVLCPHLFFDGANGLLLFLEEFWVEDGVRLKRLAGEETELADFVIRFVKDCFAFFLVGELVD
jgi:hypothetical protein